MFPFLDKQGLSHGCDSPCGTVYLEFVTYSSLSNLEISFLSVLFAVFSFF